MDMMTIRNKYARRGALIAVIIPYTVFGAIGLLVMHGVHGLIEGLQSLPEDVRAVWRGYY
jgi:p-aminobenzoyl-glutamate transporter AbgT